MRSSSSPRFLRLLAALALASVALTACGHAKKPPPEQVAAQAYLDSLGAADSAGAAARTTDQSTARAAITKSLTGLGSGVKGALTVTGLVDRQATTATANYDASWTLPGLATPWKYSGSLPMLKQGNAWLVSWSVQDIQPKLPAGSQLAVKRTQPSRATLTDDKGAPLFSPTPVVNVGIDPGTVLDLPGLASALAAVPQLQSTAAEITAAVRAAAKNQFVPIITLRRPVYEQIKAQIYNLKGTQFTTGTQLLPPASGFARQLLGSVGQATKEIIDSAKGRVADGDQVGLSGLQRALDPQLAGTAGVEVYAANDSNNALGAVIASVVAPVAGKPVQLTLDTRTQEAADAALATVPLQAAVVITQPSTGKVLAVANSASADDDIAVDGEYPAGSTFKIVTYTAEFETNPSRNENTSVLCPATTLVDGRRFENENKFSYPAVPYSAAFGYSCNTTAINIADALPNGTMYKAAQQLGLGGRWNLPVDSFAGSMPSTATGTEKAAEAIGQGKVLVSPLLMAEIVGGSATGTPRPPSLILGQQAAALPSLDPTLTAKMNALMRATVQLPGGTGNADLADLPGSIQGKTGTAEYGTAVPPKSHSWFAGTRGNLAISVFVYGGEKTPYIASKLARQFFLNLG